MKLEITDVQRQVLQRIQPAFESLWVATVEPAYLPYVAGYWLVLSHLDYLNADLLRRVEACVEDSPNIHEARAALLLGTSIRDCGVESELSAEC